MQTLYKFFLVFNILLGTSILDNIHADSLWKPSNGGLYGVASRTIREGDIITVYVNESTSAAQAATTTTRKDSRISAAANADIDRILQANNNINRNTVDFGIDGNDSYQGSGQTARSTSVKTVVSAMVTEVLETGNLFIVGEHKIKVNNEIETIRISGVVRPSDVVNNTIASQQIARIEVSVNGTGVVGKNQSPGIISRVFGWLF